MARLALSLLGPLHVTRNGQVINHFGYDKVRALLVYLAVEGGVAHARDGLAGLLWPELPNAAARTNLRQALTTLRHALGDLTAQPPVLLVTRETIQLNAASEYEVDVTTFQALMQACARHRHRHAERCTACARRSAEALALYRGEFLAELYLADSAGFEEWAALTRARLHEQAREALATLTGYYERRGAYGEAQRYARRLAELEPWNEEAHQQLMRTLWQGGQRSAALAHYRRCCALLQAELGVEPAPETTALYERIRDSTTRSSAKQPQPLQHGHTIPAATIPLLGRERELAQLADLLELRDCRLLTLVGPGGVGKTRLALQLAADLAWAFANGVVFVPLEVIADAGLVPATIARVLDVRDRSGQPILDRLSAVLRDQELLLVLDNFEQVLSAAPAVATLLRAASGLTVLVTSRAPLHLHAEQVVPVQPLATPDPCALMDLAALAEVAAVALFVRRAQAVTSDFALTATNAPAIAAICARLDGLPLAIELAAARSSLVTPQLLLTRLSSRLGLLTGGAVDLPARQQTLRATLDWSYGLLTPVEQRLFTRLAVFVGGWTLDAAETVASDGDGRLSLLDGLETLVQYSLVQHTPDDVARFGMLETIREYALEHLAASGEERTIRQRHAAYVLHVVETAESLLRGPTQGATLDRLGREHGNVQAALRWALDHDAGEVALRVGKAMYPYWNVRGPLTEGRRWLEAALVAAPKAPAALRAAVLDGAGWLAADQGDKVRALALHEQSLRLHRELGDPKGIADSLRAVGAVAGNLGDATRFRTHMDDCLALYRTLNDRWGMAVTLSNQASDAFNHLHAYARAATLFAEAQAMMRELGDQWFAARGTHKLAYVMYRQGDYAHAQALAEACIRLFRELGDPVQEAHAVFAQAMIMHAQGDRVRARHVYRDCLARAREQQDINTTASTLAHLGYLALEHGDYAEAQARLEEGLQLWNDGAGNRWVFFNGVPFVNAVTIRYMGAVARERGELAEAQVRYAESLALSLTPADLLGRTCSVIETAALRSTQGDSVTAATLLGAAQRELDTLGATLGIEQARYDRLREAVRAQLDAVTWSRAWAAGQALTLEQAVAEARDVLGNGVAQATAAAQDSGQPTSGSRARPTPRLTAREVEVLRVVAEGATDQDVAARLGLRPRTVTTYLTRIYTKLDVRTRTAAVRLAREQHLV